MAEQGASCDEIFSPMSGWEPLHQLYEHNTHKPLHAAVTENAESSEKKTGSLYILY